MIMERAVYNLHGQIEGYLIFKQDVKDKTNKEIFIGFKRLFNHKIVEF